MSKGLLQHLDSRESGVFDASKALKHSDASVAQGPDSPNDAAGRHMWGRRILPQRAKSRFWRGLFMMALAWLSIALIGAVVIVSSLVVGRVMLKALATARVRHDVYAFGIGFAVCSTALEMSVRLRQRLSTESAAAVATSLGVRLAQGSKFALAALVMGG